MTDTEPYRLAESASHLLHRAEQLAADRFSKLVGIDITLRQFAVLTAISETPGLSQNDLVRATGIDRSTLADMMTRMQARGWIERTVSAADARAHAVHLCPAGEAILVSATHHARAADAAILDLLPRTKAKSFLNVLAKISKLAEEKAAKAEARAAKVERDARRKAKRDAKAQEKAQIKAQEKASAKPRARKPKKHER